jgi:hypothetical protein
MLDACAFMHEPFDFHTSFSIGFSPGQRQCTVSDKMSLLSRHKLFERIKHQLACKETLPLLINMKLIRDMDEEESKLVDRGHTELLIFDSVSHCLVHKIAMSGPSTLNDLDDNCKAYDQLCKGPNEFRVIKEVLSPLPMWRPWSGDKERA